MTGASSSPLEVDAFDLRALAEQVRGLREDLRSALATLVQQSKCPTVDTTTTTPEPLLTITDVCKLLQVSARTLQRLRHLDEVPEPIELGGTLRWLRKDFDRWLEKKARR
jgi:predicted DNA-binding transcriptional regulator AlpA